MPEGVREVTSRRIARLPSSAREAVEVASVIGREFDFGLLEALGPLTGDDLVAALDEAVRPACCARSTAASAATRSPTRWSARRSTTASRPAAGAAALARRRDDPRPPPGRPRPVAAAARAPLRARRAGRPARARDRLRARRRPPRRPPAGLGGGGRALSRRDPRAPGHDGGDRTGGELLLALGASEERAGLEQARATFAEASALACCGSPHPRPALRRRQPRRGGRRERLLQHDQHRAKQVGKAVASGKRNRQAADAEPRQYRGRQASSSAACIRSATANTMPMKRTASLTSWPSNSRGLSDAPTSLIV